MEESKNTLVINTAKVGCCGGANKEGGCGAGKACCQNKDNNEKKECGTPPPKERPGSVLSSDEGDCEGCEGGDCCQDD
jgi:hypothetical protein